MHPRGLGTIVPRFTAENRKPSIVPILGTSKPTRIEENIGARGDDR